MHDPLDWGRTLEALKSKLRPYYATGIAMTWLVCYHEP